ncbi:IS3-like element ISAar44 family transposase, partial [Mycobacterium kansasii]
ATEEALTEAYGSLLAVGVSTRHAAALTGVVRSTAIRRRNTATAPTPAVSPQPVVEPVNKLTELERQLVVATLTSARFV